jgi:hypothetical protein
MADGYADFYCLKYGRRRARVAGRLTDAPDSEAEVAIRDGLSAHDFEKAGCRDHPPPAMPVSDPETGVGGGRLGCIRGPARTTARPQYH